jgi:serralysin
MEASSVTPSGSTAVNGLLYGTKWDETPLGTGVALTYSFQNEESVWPTYGPADEPAYAATPLSAGQIAAIEEALLAWAAVADISFEEVIDSATEAGDLRFATTAYPDTFAHAYLPSDFAYGGDAWFLGDDETLLDATPGGYGYLTFLHEIGHTLGLKHPHDDDNGFPAVAPSKDSKSFSVMSYRDFPGQDIEVKPGSTYYWYTDFYPTTPMLHDVAAIQYLYGANTSDTSDSVYQWDTDEQIYETIWDAGGEDTISWANQSSAALVNLNDGEWSKLGPPIHVMTDEDEVAGIHFNGFTAAIAFGAMIENAIGGEGDDTLIGNEGENLLEGGNGNDSLVGGSGNDTLDGGAGDDVFFVDSLDDLVIGGAGDDTVHALLDGYVQPGDVEFLFLPEPPPEEPADQLVNGDNASNAIQSGDGADTLLGNEGDDTLSGGAGGDSILGGVGNDTLQGNQGADTLRGALGNDELRGGQDDDVVYSGQGNDQALGALGADELRGGLGNDTLQGGQGNDTLSGGEGDDFLQPRLGNDVVTGGAGADIFWFNAAGAADADAIVDFEDGIDKIMLDGGVFTDPASIEYDASSGELSYAGQLIATLPGAPAITAEDFL